MRRAVDWVRILRAPWFVRAPARPPRALVTLLGFDVTCVGAGRALCQTGLSVHVRQLVRVWGVPAEQA